MKPMLVIAYGNPSRGDDALGPELMARMEQQDFPDVEWITDFQLQIEHTLDMLGREAVLFVDASMSANAPYEFTHLQAKADLSISSHALSPQALMEVFSQVHDQAVPECYVLAVRGESFELGDDLSLAAQMNLLAAVSFCKELFQKIRWSSGLINTDISDALMLNSRLTESDQKTSELKS